MKPIVAKLIAALSTPLPAGMSPTTWALFGWGGGSCKRVAGVKSGWLCSLPFFQGTA